MSSITLVNFEFLNDFVLSKIESNQEKLSLILDVKNLKSRIENDINNLTELKDKYKKLDNYGWGIEALVSNDLHIAKEESIKLVLNK